MVVKYILVYIIYYLLSHFGEYVCASKREIQSRRQYRASDIYILTI